MSKNIIKINFIGAGRLALATYQRLLRQKEQKYLCYATTTTTDKINQYPLINWTQYRLGQEKPIEMPVCDIYFISIPPSATNYYQGIKKLLKVIPPTSKIIFVSSISVYQEHGKQNEKTPISQPHSANGEVLRKVEALIEQNFKKFIITRPGGFLWSNINKGPMLLLKRKKCIEINGQATLNLVHFDDLVTAHFILITQQIKAPILNIVAPFHPCKEDFYTEIARQLNLDIPLFQKGQADNRVICGELITKLYPFQYQAANLIDKLVNDLNGEKI